MFRADPIQLASRPRERAPLSRSMDDLLERRHLEARRVLLWGQVDDASARHIVDRLLYLESLDPEAEIRFVINSPGGANTAGFAMLDAMRGLSCPVATLCTGLAASFGALLLAAGAPGRRFALPHARIMIHQPWVPGEIQAPATDLRIHAEEIGKQRDLVNRILAEACGKSLDEIAADTDRDRWFDPAAAKAYGLIDDIADRY